jgi:hypothetical protein
MNKHWQAQLSLPVLILEKAGLEISLLLLYLDMGLQIFRYTPVVR